MPSNIEVITMDYDLFVDARLNGHYVYKLPRIDANLVHQSDVIAHYPDFSYKYVVADKAINDNKIILNTYLSDFVLSNPRYFFEHGHVTPNYTFSYSNYRLLDNPSNLTIGTDPMAKINIYNFNDQLVDAVYTDSSSKLTKYYNFAMSQPDTKDSGWIVDPEDDVDGHRLGKSIFPDIQGAIVHGFVDKNSNTIYFLDGLAYFISDADLTGLNIRHGVGNISDVDNPLYRNNSYNAYPIVSIPIYVYYPHLDHTTLRVSPLVINFNKKIHDIKNWNLYFPNEDKNLPLVEFRYKRKNYDEFLTLEQVGDLYINKDSNILEAAYYPAPIPTNSNLNRLYRKSLNSVPNGKPLINAKEFEDYAYCIDKDDILVTNGYISYEPTVYYNPTTPGTTANDYYQCPNLFGAIGNLANFTNKDTTLEDDTKRLTSETKFTINNIRDQEAKLIVTTSFCQYMEVNYGLEDGYTFAGPSRQCQLRVNKKLDINYVQDVVKIDIKGDKGTQYSTHLFGLQDEGMTKAPYYYIPYFKNKFNLNTIQPEDLYDSNATEDTEFIIKAGETVEVTLTFHNVEYTWDEAYITLGGTTKYVDYIMPYVKIKMSD